MAKVLENTRKRGRKPAALRLAARMLAAEVKATKGTRTETIVVREPSGNKGDRGETATFEIPKGAALIPIALTEGKTDENVRTTIANAASDVGTEVKVASGRYELEQDENGKPYAAGAEAPQGTVFFLLHPNTEGVKGVE